MVSEWVSVNDKFPEGHQVVVRFIKPFFGVPNACYEMGYFEDPDKAEEDYSGWFYWKDNKPITYPVTHWKKLDTMEDEAP